MLDPPGYELECSSRAGFSPSSKTRIFLSPSIIQTFPSESFFRSAPDVSVVTGVRAEVLKPMTPSAFKSCLNMPSEVTIDDRY